MIRKGRSINRVSLERKIDTATATGERVFHVFEVIEQFEG